MYRPGIFGLVVSHGDAFRAIFSLEILDVHHAEICEDMGNLLARRPVIQKLMEDTIGPSSRTSGSNRDARGECPRVQQRDDRCSRRHCDRSHQMAVRGINFRQ